jgi:hypothetical protein
MEFVSVLRLASVSFASAGCLQSSNRQAVIFGDMSQSDRQVNAYQLRIALHRTGPHIWRGVVVRSGSTLGQLHQTVQALFGWADSRPLRFVLRGCSLGASATAAVSSWPAPEALLSEFRLQANKERFFYG